MSLGLLIQSVSFSPKALPKSLIDLKAAGMCLVIRLAPLSATNPTTFILLVITFLTASLNGSLAVSPTNFKPLIIGSRILSFPSLTAPLTILLALPTPDLNMSSRLVPAPLRPTEKPSLRSSILARIPAVLSAIC